MKKIGILGSTGSIGVNALNVVAAHPDRFSVRWLTANKNAELLVEQARRFRPDYVVIADDSLYVEVKTALRDLPMSVQAGYAAVVQAAADTSTDLVLNSIVGSKGLEPTVAALRAGIDVALSNKESLVMAGEQINALAASTGAEIYPVDSEHSAIWQCLAGEAPSAVSRLILTGSGGPFLRRDLDSFDRITVEEALAHPNWSMGSKITIDSATMMNKGLELIEAYHLFHIPVKRIDIVIHPQSIIHSMVKFIDTSIKAQLGVPDMKIPIQYALAWPDRLSSNWENLDFAKLARMDFFEPDFRRFPALRLAYEAIEAGGSYPTVLNVCNEQAVYLFLKGKIRFTQIPELVEQALSGHTGLQNPGIDDILHLEKNLINYMQKVEENL